MTTRLFAGKDNPIRCSKLASITKCSMRIVMLELDAQERDDGGPPAQTGSVVHVGVAEFHRLSTETLAIRKKGAWDSINEAMKKFPLADPTEVRLYITPYMDDPRNIHAVMLAVELPVEFTLDPHTSDTTGEKIYVQGTLDQIRQTSYGGEVWDLKTGKKSGWELIHDHAIQLASYTIGAQQAFKRSSDRIVPGGIIRAMGYRTKDKSSASPYGVFFSMPYQVDDIPLILEPVQLAVAHIRSGYATFGPGPHCTYCEYGGLTGCIPHYQKLKKA